MQAHTMTRTENTLPNGARVVKVMCKCGVMFTGDADKGARRHLEAVREGREDLGTLLKGWAAEEFARSDEGR